LRKFNAPRLSKKIPYHGEQEKYFTLSKDQDVTSSKEQFEFMQIGTTTPQRHQCKRIGTRSDRNLNVPWACAWAWACAMLIHLLAFFNIFSTVTGCEIFGGRIDGY